MKGNFALRPTQDGFYTLSDHESHLNISLLLGCVYSKFGKMIKIKWTHHVVQKLVIDTCVYVCMHVCISTVSKTGAMSELWNNLLYPGSTR